MMSFKLEYNFRVPTFVHNSAGFIRQNLHALSSVHVGFDCSSVQFSAVQCSVVH